MSDPLIPPGTRPDWTASIRARLAGVDLDPLRLDDIADELAQHLDDRYDELRADGLDVERARRAALDELAAPHVLARALRTVTAPPAPPAAPVLGAPASRGWLAGLRHDVRDGLRS